jgi:hypothetical protein
MYMSGREMVATFWPTVGTVLPAVEEGVASPSGCRVLYSALIWERRVVLPALSRPRRRMEYSAREFQQMTGERGRKLGKGGACLLCW